MCSLVTLSKYYSTKSKTLLAESFGQRLLVVFTALSPFYVEQPHDKGSALYKHPTNSCKNNIKRSTGPKLIIFSLKVLLSIIKNVFTPLINICRF
ncbi:hypothetical protein [Candidatus Colwellia aromaticivorans]|uniref:hypothetical protein n=1 Tax=Candidatus Colwellia aromaticivorans TaxID=2267621 RepID=UPI000DF30BB8|nr:hypothetical protein [Candidatus Colwellia aromaticivorans]